MTIKAEFNRLSRPADAKLVRLIDAIIAERPDLADATFGVPDKGNTALTLIVGDEVFKAPANCRQIGALAREFHLQESFTKAGVAGIAPVTYVGKNACFYAVKKLDGVHPAFWRMTKEERAACWARIGQTIADAGQVDKPRLRRAAAGKYVAAGVGMWLNSRGFAALWREKASALSAAIDDYAWRFSKRKYALAHGDLHVGNIFTEADNKTFKGIIDWANAYHTRAPELAFRELGFQIGEHMPHYDPPEALAAFKGFCAAQDGALYKSSDIIIANVLKKMGLYELDKKHDMDWWIDDTNGDVSDDLECLGMTLDTSAATPRRRAGNTPK